MCCFLFVLIGIGWVIFKFARKFLAMSLNHWNVSTLCQNYNNWRIWMTPLIPLHSYTTLGFTICITFSIPFLCTEKNIWHVFTLTLFFFRARHIICKKLSIYFRQSSNNLKSEFRFDFGRLKLAKFWILCLFLWPGIQFHFFLRLRMG